MENKTKVNAPTPEQIAKLEELSKVGYVWDKPMSIAAAGVVMRKGDDIWFFGLVGEIMHNPEGYSIKC